MALHNVGELKAGVQGLLQNINLSKVVNLNGAIERAARILVQQADIPAASGVEPITLYSGVNYYLAPSTIFGGAINLIRRQGAASAPWDYSYKVPVDTFTRAKNRLPNGYMLDIEFKNGVAYLGISTPIPSQRVVLDTMTQTAGWVASGTASGLTTDTTNYYQQPASLRFTLTGAGAGILTKTLPNSLQMEDYQGVGVAFIALQIPQGVPASDLAEIALALGSSPSDFDAVQVNEGFLGAWTSGEWLLVAFDFASTITTGTPDWSAINYIQVGFLHGGTLVNMRVGGLWMSLPSPNEILFQSSALFKGSLTPATQAITNDGDTIILNDAAYTLLEHESALAVAIQQGGDLASGQVQMLRGILYGTQNDEGLYKLYRGDNPSQELRTVGSWYDVGSNGGGYTYG